MPLAGVFVLTLDGDYLARFGDLPTEIGRNSRPPPEFTAA